jgi:hypothetical protein
MAALKPNSLEPSDNSSLGHSWLSARAWLRAIHYVLNGDGVCCVRVCVSQWSRSEITPFLVSLLLVACRHKLYRAVQYVLNRSRLAFRGRCCKVHLHSVREVRARRNGFKQASSQSVE